MTQPTTCHSMQCILPPHMVEAIEMRGSAAQKQMARALQEHADEAREERMAAAPADAFLAVASVGPGDEPRIQREVYDNERKATLPGKRVRREKDPLHGDEDVNHAFDGAGATYKLYLEVYRRDSLDGKGLILKSTVHHRQGYNNAFWNGQQMAYGDGDGDLFKSLSRDLSVIGHELSHGVVQFSGGLIYQDQSGALNEHFADVFGALTEQYKEGQEAHEANWLIGRNILANGVNGAGLRSLKAPGTAYDDRVLGKDPQPYHMGGYVNTTSDNGGVHINSGIPNHAFYLLAMMLGGRAWEKAGHIWYDTLQVINNPHARFTDWADKTVEKARERYGTGSVEALYTRRAWKLVGIDV